MVCTWNQITDIIKTNPAKERIAYGRKMADKLMLHVYGVGMETALQQCDHFESPDIFKIREKYAVSNKDMFGRLLQQEDMVFSAKGGSSYFNLSESDEKRMNAVVDEVRYGMSLRKWIQNFALPAYRVDPMGIIFMEVERTDVNRANTPKAYPTYKSIYSIYDYDTTGRRLEYVCFQLTAQQAIAFGVVDSDLKDGSNEITPKYYRFVDDEKDIIVKRDGDKVTKAAPDLWNNWTATPGFVISNLMLFYEPKKFVSPLDLTTELADSFLFDRSVRDLQKRYHGFSKAVEPLIDCGTCNGTGLVAGEKCPDCKGSKYKTHTKVSDVARFPVSMFQEGNFDFKKIFGYVAPDVEGWNKQDQSLNELYSSIYQTYWGTTPDIQAQGPQKGGNLEETATKTLSNLQPKYSRLNQTAEWAEKTEGMIADFIGKFWFPESFKRSSIAYGRYYILETPDELMAAYQKMRAAGAPEATLFDSLEKYYSALYQNAPYELAVRTKLLYVEPFPHMKISEAKGVVSDFLDFNCKLYFGEWYSTKKDIEILSLPSDKLREDLRAYVRQKGLKEPKPEIANQN